ncbi:hypothetical protein GCM10023347_37260 [Streptomyces chumphonensis]|uniref:Uncharacterized protein n=1 Tax=Streptomyces chumphonensis TaxID=1214925 RepID=A0A927EW74_9ACTN|nr:hypothetical protein [Streptomyces chumphonensis]MBD3930738.1 hypothetical protein [Streptomyces chumphonensis]
MSHHQPPPDQPPGEPSRPPGPPPAGPPSLDLPPVTPPPPPAADPPAASAPSDQPAEETADVPPTLPPPPPPPPPGHAPAAPGPEAAGPGRGRLIGLAVAAVVLVGAVIAGVLLLTGGDDDTSAVADRKPGASQDAEAGRDSEGGEGPEDADRPDAEPGTEDGGDGDRERDGDSPSQDPADRPGGQAPYELVLPEGLLDTYTLIAGEDGGLPTDTTGFDEAIDAMRVEGAQGTQGAYSTWDPSDPESLQDPSALESMEMLIVAGAWGVVQDPEASVDGFFAKLKTEQPADADGELQGTPQAMSPDGLDGAVMKCQIMSNVDFEGRAQETSLCVWADDSTVAVVMPIPMSGSRSLAEGAQLTADVRAELRVAAD